MARSEIIDNQLAGGLGAFCWALSGAHAAYSLFSAGDATPSLLWALAGCFLVVQTGWLIVPADRRWKRIGIGIDIALALGLSIISAQAMTASLMTWCTAFALQTISWLLPRLHAPPVADDRFGQPSIARTALVILGLAWMSLSLSFVMPVYRPHYVNWGDGPPQDPPSMNLLDASGSMLGCISVPTLLLFAATPFLVGIPRREKIDPITIVFVVAVAILISVAGTSMYPSAGIVSLIAAYALAAMAVQANRMADRIEIVQALMPSEPRGFEVVIPRLQLQTRPNDVENP